MVNEKVEKAFNDQIREETFSAYLYWSMSAWFESQNLSGFASWMRCQAQEEMIHAMKFYTFLHDVGGEVKLQALEQPKSEWSSVLDAYKDAYDHECHISSRINELVKLAKAENANAALRFLDWFVTEQVEEEATADGFVQNLKLVGDNGHGILMLDREAASRTFTPAASEEE